MWTAILPGLRRLATRAFWFTVGAAIGRAAVAVLNWIAASLKKAGMVFKLMAAHPKTSAVIVSVLLLAFPVGAEFGRDTILIRPIAVPQDLVKQGLTPAVVAERLIDEIVRIGQESTTSKDRRALDSERALPDIEIPGVGFSLRSIVFYVRELTGFPPRMVAGEIVFENDKPRLRLRITVAHRQVLNIAADKLACKVRASESDCLLHYGAREVLRIADPYILAAYLHDKDPKATLDLIYQIFDQGPKEDVPWAQALLGFAYENGAGVPQDYVEAVRWYRKAAALGNAPAQHNLGVMYHSGKGVTKDGKKAARWYRKAAEQGHAFAQNNLGTMYQNGTDVPLDEEEAARWFRKSAVQGNSAAQYNLGTMYDDGKGVAEDNEEAVSWYRKAAVQGNANAQNGLGTMYEEGTGVAKDDKEAVRWYRNAAAQGNAFAQKNLGFMYENGTGVAKDDEEAVRWYHKAATQGNATAQNRLGFMYTNGRGVLESLVEAYYWYSLAMKGEPSLANHDQSVASLEHVKTTMTPEEIAEAKQRVRDWDQKETRK